MESVMLIQELLGHGDVRTDAICTNTVKSLAIKRARSPIGFNIDSKTR